MLAVEADTYRDSSFRPLDLDGLDLVVNQPQDIRDEWSKDGVEVFSMLAENSQ
jgi:hypothetical protein